MAAQWASHAMHSGASLFSHAQAALQPFAAVALSRVERTVNPQPHAAAFAKAVCPPMRGGSGNATTQSNASGGIDGSSGSSSNGSSNNARRATQNNLSGLGSSNSNGGFFSASGTTSSIALRKLFPHSAAAAAYLHTQTQPGTLSGELAFKSPANAYFPDVTLNLSPAAAASLAAIDDDVANDSDGTREEDALLLAQQERRSISGYASGTASGTASAGGNLRIASFGVHNGLRSPTPMDTGARLATTLGKPMMRPHTGAHSASMSTATAAAARRRPSLSPFPPTLADAVNRTPVQTAAGMFVKSDAELELEHRVLQRQFDEEQEARELLEAADDATAEEEELGLPSVASARARSAAAAVPSPFAPSNDLPASSELVKLMYETTKQTSLTSKQRLAQMPTDYDQFFATRPARSLAQHNEYLRACAQQGRYEEGMAAYHQRMLPMGLAPDDVTYVALLGLCKVPGANDEAKAQRMQFAMSLLDDYQKRFSGRVSDAFWNALINVTARLDSLERAEEVMKLMRASGVQPSQITYTELINACRRVGTASAIERGVKLFEGMQSAGAGSSLEPDVQTYNAMLRMAALNGKGTEYAIKLFDEMREKKYQPTLHTYSNLILACGKNAHYYAQAFEYFAAALAQGFKADLQLYNILLNACATGGRGDLANAMHLFRSMESQGIERDTVSYNAMLNVLAESQTRGDKVPLAMVPRDGGALTDKDYVDKNQRIEMAQQLLQQMEQTAVPIDLTTVNTAVKVAARALRLNNTPKLQTDLLSRHGFTADVHSHAMLVEMYTSANRLDKALERVTMMRGAGFTPSRALYREMIKRVSKPKKGLVESGDIESVGQQILRHMKVDGYQPKPEDERLFDAKQYGAYLQTQRAAAVARDTVKTGILHSFPQRADAMLRPSDKRVGSARPGSQPERFAANPQLAKHKAKRSQRAADAKDKAQGINPVKKREQAIADGHHYE